MKKTLFVLGLAINASQREEQEFLEETRKLALGELKKEYKKSKNSGSLSNSGGNPKY